MYNFRKDSPGGVCPQHPNNTKPDEWKTIFEEHVLRKSRDPDEYFSENIAGFLITDDKQTNQPTYITWFSNEVISDCTVIKRRYFCMLCNTRSKLMRIIYHLRL